MSKLKSFIERENIEQRRSLSIETSQMVNGFVTKEKKEVVKSKRYNRMMMMLLDGKPLLMFLIITVLKMCLGSEEESTVITWQRGVKEKRKK